MNTKTTILFLLLVLASHGVAGVQILSKSKLQKCEKSSESGDLNCTKKIVLNMAVPSGSVLLLSLMLHFSFCSLLNFNILFI